MTDDIVINLATTPPVEVETLSTGAKRSTQEQKGRYDLISPLPERRLALLMERGASVYGNRNWEKGIPLSRYLSAARRHLAQWQEGKRDEDHAAAAYWNLHCLMHTEEAIKLGLLPKELNDLPSYVPPNPGDPPKE